LYAIKKQKKNTVKIKSLILLFTFVLLSSCKSTLQFGEIYFDSNNVNYDEMNKNDKIKIAYQNEISPYLNKLKEKYPLNTVYSEKDSDKEKVLKVLNWTNNRWEHNGRNSPKNNDAISILKEAEEGGQFPCFAFAIVLRDQLNAIGFRARTVYLKTENAQKSKYPPGHVATEVFLNDIQKWAFIDGQFNVMPVLDDKPINATEFQKAITLKSDELKLLSLKSIVKEGEYYSFVYPYLFYLDTTLDNRYEFETPFLVNKKSSLMLVPNRAKNLTRINFWNMDIDNCIYTNSTLDFYAKPN